MQKNDEELDPLNKLRNKLQGKQPSEKPVNDVLDAENSDAMSESQFVHATREELGDENTETASAKEQVPGKPHDNMPDSERVTEKD